MTWPMPVPLSRALLFASGALCLIAIVARARVYWPFTVDDTFITMRYAKHLAEGLGPSWNPRGAPVEGYTTALWMGVLALPHALGLDALLFAKLAGIASALASVAAAAALAYELTRGLDVRARHFAAVASLALCAAYWPLALHAISGMETALAALLLTTFALVSTRFVSAPTALRARSLTILALLMTLARPEGALACLGTSLALWLVLRSPGRALLARASVRYLVLPGTAYFAARYAYFGLAFPLSFYVKAQGQARFAGLPELRAFFAPLLWEHPVLGMLALSGVRDRRVGPALAGLGAFALFFVFPAHVMGFEGRYLFPLFPSYAALVGAGAGRLHARVLRARSAPTSIAPPAPAHPDAAAPARVSDLAPPPTPGSASTPARAPRRLPDLAPLALPRWAEPLLALAAWGLCAGLALPAHEPEARRRWLDYGAGLARAHVALAKELRKSRLAVTAPTIALLDVGAVAYYSDWFTIDTFGLNDRRVALSRRTDVPYVFSYRPELLVVVSAEPQRYVEVFEWERPLYATALRRGYAPLCSYPFLADYHLLVLARAGSPLRRTLACAPL